MKLHHKSIFILFLIISSSILSVHSNIKYSTIYTKHSESLNFGEGPETTDSPNISEEIYNYEKELENSTEESRLDTSDSSFISMMTTQDSDFSSLTEKERSFEKVINFILGMMQQIPIFTPFGVILQGVIDNVDKPECSKQRLMDEFYMPRVTSEMKQKAAKELMSDFLTDLGDGEDLEDLDWSNPRETCRKVKKLHEEKLDHITSTVKNSHTLLEFAKKVLKNEETFEEFEEAIGGFLRQIFHLNRAKLLNFMRDINFDGDSQKMRNTYKDYARWRKDLKKVVNMLEDSKKAAEIMLLSFLQGEDANLDCSELPRTNMFETELLPFSEQFIGALYTLKQVALCLNIDVLFFMYLLRFGVKEILCLVANIFGFYIAKLLYFALLLTQFSFFLYKGFKTDAIKHLDKKWRLFGRAAGVIYNLISSLMLK